MRRTITDNTKYNFNPTLRTIKLPEYTNVNLGSLLFIINATDNLVIFNCTDATKGATVSGNVITLAYNTTSMSATDDLQIFIDDGDDLVDISGEKGRKAEMVQDLSVQDLLSLLLTEVKELKILILGAIT